MFIKKPRKNNNKTVKLTIKAPYITLFTIWKRSKGVRRTLGNSTIRIEGNFLEFEEAFLKNTSKGGGVLLEDKERKRKGKHEGGVELL